MSQRFPNESGQDLQEQADLYTVDVFELLYWLADHARRIFAAALAGALLMGLYSFVLAKPVYSATSTIYVLSSSDSAINLADLQIGSYLTSDYKHVFETWEVKEMVLQRLGLDYTYSQMHDMLEVTNPSNTRMLNITVSSKDPQEAADMANAYAAVASEYISATMKTDAPTLMSQALVPEIPVSPRKKLNLLLGAAGGAFLMTLMLLVQYLLDDKVKTAEDIVKHFDMPVLAAIPLNQDAAGKRRRGSAR